jgi:protein-disulfide isomerase
MSIWKVLGWLFGLLLAIGVILFIRQSYTYYTAIRSGATNPLLEQQLEATISRLSANQSVSNADLDHLVDPAAPSLGDASATVTIVEFLDYGCPYCRAAFEPVRESVLRHEGKVRLVIRDFPLEDIHPGATKAAVAARCAQEQGKFWAYHDKLFLRDQRSFTDEDLVDIATESGLDLSAFNSCRASSRAKALVDRDLTTGLQVGVAGTPTFFFNRVRIKGAPSAEALEFIIQRFLNSPTK